MYVIITGIKSEKTRNLIAKNFMQCKVTGSHGNYQIKVDYAIEHPIAALRAVYEDVRNLTPDHLANLKWKVQK